MHFRVREQGGAGRSLAAAGRSGHGVMNLVSQQRIGAV